jgi:hypothetical protein
VSLHPAAWITRHCKEQQSAEPQNKAETEVPTADQDNKSSDSERGRDQRQVQGSDLLAAWDPNANWIVVRRVESPEEQRHPS